MIHPHTRLQHISDIIGYGVFATQFIPAGTIIYAKDVLDVEVLTEDYLLHDLAMQQIIEKYSYMDERGIRIISWDLAKYVNHCCDSNTLSASFGFDIAVRDIHLGEEITCDYGLLNAADEMPLYCSKLSCRGVLRPTDFDTCVPLWDKKLKAVLPQFSTVEQPLLSLIEPEIIELLLAYGLGEIPYESVSRLKFQQSLVV